MNLAEALSVLVPLLRDELVVHANGFISRESFNCNDRPGNFYMIGSMGLASSIALGVALNRPDRCHAASEPRACRVRQRGVRVNWQPTYDFRSGRFRRNCPFERL